MSRLRNYTTTISTARTISEIERLLALYGASAIQKRYKNAEVFSFVFTITGPYGTQTFQLPLDVPAFQQRLIDLKNNGELPGISKKDVSNPDKARRIGWRVIKDWVDAQLTLIDAGQLTMQDVFFQYMIDEGGRPLRQVVGKKLLALTEGKDG